MGKNVQISEQDFLNGFFLALYVRGDFEEELVQELAEKVFKAYEEKLEAIVRRGLYTKYKTAPTEAEREQARIEYLAHSDLMVDDATFQKIMGYQKNR